MTKSMKTKLSLSRETLQHLSAEALQHLGVRFEIALQGENAYHPRLASS